MSRIADIGRYIELLSMDKHFHDISIALHIREGRNGRFFTLHTYSRIPGADDRLKNLASLMVSLGGLEQVVGAAHVLRLPCGESHNSALKRVFNEVVMLDPATALEAKPLTVHEDKTGRNISVDCIPDEGGRWTYAVNADGPREGLDRRVKAVAAGLIKLCDAQQLEKGSDRITFGCGYDHRNIIGLLLPRALNIRAVIEAEEAGQKRGVLAAPSNQSL